MLQTLIHKATIAVIQLRVFLMTAKVTLLIHTVQLTEKLFRFTAMKMRVVTQTMEKYYMHSNNGDSTTQPPCHYYNTAYGCRYSDKRRFGHNMISSESGTITSSDESGSGYDTDDEPCTKLYEYDGSSYNYSDEYGSERIDKKEQRRIGPI